MKLLKKVSVLILAFLIMVSCLLPVQADSKVEYVKPSKPVGTENELNTEAPIVSAPLSAVDYGGNANDSILKNIALTNPFIHILDGFDQIWSMNQPIWRNGTALTISGVNGEVAKYGDGPTVYFDGYKNDETKVVADKNTYAKEEIRDSETWKANIKYVEDVTKNRTEAEALAAYYDDQRDKVYSMMEAFGPLANTYVNIVKPVTNIIRTKEEMNRVLEEATVEDEAQGMGQWESSELADAMDLVHLIRFRNPSSSNPAKYFFSSPRPYRMNSNGEVKEVVDEKGLPVWVKIGNGENTVEELPSGGKKETGERRYQQYETNVKVIPALEYVKRKAEDGRGKDGAFPSGHTSASYLSTFGFAYATPERYAEFLTRAAVMGENRIVAGMHSPLDVIGARIQATAMTAYAYNLAENKEVLNKAYDNAGEVFGKIAESKGVNLYEFAHTVTEDYTFESAYDEKQFENHEENKAFYREKLTYGLPQTGTKGLDPVVPKGAEVLLETRQPYLTEKQRREVLYTTEIDSGYPVIDESNGWGRLDLVTASDGYGAFLNNVTVNMDASKGRFNAHDWWRNDISGSGMLTKQGTGMLTLTGNNSYTGGTLLQEGTLEATSATAFGKGDLYIENGETIVNTMETLDIYGDVTLESGVITIALDNAQTQVNVEGTLYLEEGNLNLDLSNYESDPLTEITLIHADKVIGNFDTVTADGYDVTLTYKDTSVMATIKPIDSSKPVNPVPEEPKEPINPENPEQSKDPVTPDNTDNSNDSKKQSHVILTPKINNGEVTFKTEDLESVANNGVLRIDLQDHNESVKLLFTLEQIKYLKENNVNIIIELKNVSLQIGTSNFANESGPVSIDLKRMADIEEALSVVYDFEMKQGGKRINILKEKVLVRFSINDKKVINKSNVQLFYWNAEIEKWEEAGGKWKEDSIIAEINHFSTFTVFEGEIDGQAVFADASQTLPETSTTMYQYMLIGLFLLLCGATYFFLRRKKA